MTRRDSRYHMKKLILVCLLFSLAFCNKNVPAPGLPAITEEGKNSFGFKLNGNTWVPYYDCNSFSGTGPALTFLVYQDDSGRYAWPIGFDLNAKRSSGNSTDYFEMKTRSIISGNPAYISRTGNIFDSLEISFHRSDCCAVYTSVPNDPRGMVNVTKLDTLNKIISGTFSFTLYSYTSQNTDSMVITEGRFDMKFDGSICY